MHDNETEKPAVKRPKGVYIGFGMGAGIAIGVGLGAAMDNMGVGIAIGIAMGAAIGFAMQRARTQKGASGPE